MSIGSKRTLIAIGMIGVVSIGVWGIQSASQTRATESWTRTQEGLLAVAPSSGSIASLRNDLSKARPATAAEAVTWINTWPVRTPDQGESLEETELDVAARSREVRCTGTPTGDTVPQRGDEEETIQAIQKRRECTYAKWMVWSGNTADERPNERHTVWVDEHGRFHGRVDYWR